MTLTSMSNIQFNCMSKSNNKNVLCSTLVFSVEKECAIIEDSNMMNMGAYSGIKRLSFIVEP